MDNPQESRASTVAKSILCYPHQLGGVQGVSLCEVGILVAWTKRKRERVCSCRRGGLGKGPRDAGKTTGEVFGRKGFSHQLELSMTSPPDRVASAGRTLSAV